jgi:ferredoxin like protein
MELAETMNIEAKLGLNAFKPAEESHIRIHHEICRRECREKYCLFVCPAHLYAVNEETGDLYVDFAGCLECGTCHSACRYGALEWEYPQGGFGVQFRFG